jgi:glycosyltransferase involved in cell wall biosynthesis
MEHGEAQYSGNLKYGNVYLKKELAGLSGVIAVSNQNKHYVVDSGIVKEEITVVYPNCFREERFFPMDKAEARKHFGWDEKCFIVGFAGSFDDRKGPLRLQDAVEKVDGVYFACAGSGKEVPTSEKCIWAKPVLHKDLVYFYNALDAFVLPTLAEGSCTATAEAIGCGCPIISSNRQFNESLCFEDNSIVVDPENIDEIASAIQKIKDNPQLEESMRTASLRRAENLKQGKRMKEIANFMQSKARRKD